MTTAQVLELWHEHPARSHLETLSAWSLPADEGHLLREFRDALTGLELQWTEKRIGRMPKIVDLSDEEKKELLVLQRRRQELREALQGETS